MVTLWILLAVAVLAAAYLAIAFFFVLLLIVAIQQRQWEVFLFFLIIGALPIGAVTWRALRAEMTALRAARAHGFRGRRA